MMRALCVGICLAVAATATAQNLDPVRKPFSFGPLDDVGHGRLFTLGDPGGGNLEAVHLEELEHGLGDLDVLAPVRLLEDRKGLPGERLRACRVGE